MKSGPPVSCPPLRRGDTGGFFEGLRAAPGSSFTRSQTAVEWALSRPRTAVLPIRERPPTGQVLQPGERADLGLDHAEPVAELELDGVLVRPTLEDDVAVELHGL